MKSIVKGWKDFLWYFPTLKTYREQAETTCSQFFMGLQLFSHVIVLMAPMDIHSKLYRFLHTADWNDDFPISLIFVTVCNYITILAAS